MGQKANCDPGRDYNCIEAGSPNYLTVERARGLCKPGHNEKSNPRGIHSRCDSV